MNQLSKTTIKDLMAIAQDSCLIAGRALLKNKSSWNKVSQNAGRDIKLDADKKAENLIIAYLKENSSYPILAEESGPNNGDPLSAETFWAVDPLDGSANYTSHIPFCGPAVALVHHGVPIIGVIYDISHDELYTGGTELGSTINGAPITVSTVKKKSDAKLMTGFPVNRDMSEKSLLKFSLEVQQWKKVRMIGSAAISLAYVASGKADAYQEESIMFWDIAAGWAIVEAAGGYTKAEITSFDAPINFAAANNQALL